MSKVKVKLNRSGVGQLLKGAEVQELLGSIASDIRAKAGDGYEQDSYVGKRRANAMVYADSIRAKRDNLKNNTLVKAMRASKR